MKLRKILEKVEAASGFTSEEKGDYFIVYCIENNLKANYLAMC
jgi:hypothetical protein